MESKTNLLCVLSRIWQGALGFNTQTLINAHFTPLPFIMPIVSRFFFCMK